MPYNGGGRLATPVSLADGGTGAALVDPNADRILFWDDSAGAFTFLAAGSGLTIAGTTITASGGFTNGTFVAASGTAVDFTGIPAGVNQVVIQVVDGLSQSGTAAEIHFQIGDSDGIETTGYNAVGRLLTDTPAISSTFSTAAFPLITGAATVQIWGALTLSLIDPATNFWVAAGVFRSGAGHQLLTGQKSLSGTLDRVRITTSNGTDLLDAGSLNILYI